MIDIISYDQIKFSFVVSNGTTHTFNLNHKISSVPNDKIIWDAFGTKDWYTNLSISKKISSIHENMITIFSQYYNHGSESNFDLANPNTQASATWATRYQENGYDGWLIKTSLLFNISEDNSSIPVCSHYTGMVGGQKIVSSGYLFANVVSAHVCSHPKVASNMQEPSFCPYSENQNSCPFYEASEEILRSDDISYYGSDSSTTFQLSVSKTLGSTSVYTITNKTLNQVSNVIYSPSRSEETDLNAIEVYEEMLTAYSDPYTKVSNTEIVEDIQKQRNSYILSLS